MIETLRKDLSYIEDCIYYMEQTDTAWSKSYAKLCKQRKILKRAIRRLERLEK